jgi:hypothetical protein
MATAVAVVVALGLAGCGVSSGGERAGGGRTATDERTASDGTASDTETDVIGSTNPTDTGSDETGSDETGSDQTGSGADRDAYIDAVLATGGSLDEQVSESSARCLAGALVDGVGIDELEANDVSPEDFARGRFIDALGWGLDDISTYSAEVGRNLEGCTFASELMAASFADRYPDLSMSDETRGCIDQQFAGPIGDIVVKSIVDPTYDAADAGAKLAPSLLAGCPSLATEVTVAELEVEGKHADADGVACLRAQYEALSNNKDEITSEDVSGAILACRSELGL